MSPIEDETEWKGTMFLKINLYFEVEGSVTNPHLYQEVFVNAVEAKLLGQFDSLELNLPKHIRESLIEMGESEDVRMFLIPRRKVFNGLR